MARGRRKSQQQYALEVEYVTKGEWKVVGEYAGALERVRIKHTVCGNIISRQAFKVSESTKCERCELIERGKSFYSFVREVVSHEYDVLSGYVNDSTLIYMRHNRCRHIYQVRPNNFKNGNRCPNCFGVVKITESAFLERLPNSFMEAHEILGEFKGAKIPMNIRHIKCGEIFKAKPISLLQGKRCPKCIRSYGENRVEEVLIKLGVEYQTEWTIGGGELTKLRYDFYLPEYRSCIEFDGSQHFKVVDRWGGDDALKGIMVRDMVKNHYCFYKSIELLRIPSWQFNDIESIVVEFIDKLRRREIGTY